MRRKTVYLAAMLLLGVSGLFHGRAVASSDALSSAEKGIFELEHIGMQIQTVTIEMSLYLAEEEEDSVNYRKGASVSPAKKAVLDLAQVKADLLALSLPPKLNGLRPQFVGAIEKLSGIYTAIAQGDKIDQEKEFDAFGKLVEKYNKNLDVQIKRFLEVPPGMKEVNVLGLESNLFGDLKDREKFLSADKLIVEKKYAEAAAILKDLLTHYKDTPAEGSVVVRLADCSEMGGYKLIGETAKPEYVKMLLDSFIAKKSYSPRVQEIYLQWRTLKQSFDNGVSNWSKIPNDKYVEALWELAQSIERYLQDHPADAWAKYQLLLLMDTGLIERFTPNSTFGNSAIIDQYDLWRLPEDESKKEKKTTNPKRKSGNEVWTVETDGSKVSYRTHGGVVWGHSFGFSKDSSDCKTDMLWLTFTSPTEKVKEFEGKEVEILLTVDGKDFGIEVPLVSVVTRGITHGMIFTNAVPEKQLIDALKKGRYVTVKLLKPKKLIALLDIKQERFDLTGFTAKREEAEKVCKNKPPSDPA